ncbi:ParA family protein, partial [Porphyromonas levii]|uniref:ParA family protein n=1 Tax=Porphyromonas levii TaxID=28114 RepID=UPI002938F55E
IISIVNYKGGVGKTTTSASLLAGLTEMGKRAIGIDLDGQANLFFVKVVAISYLCRAMLHLS